MSSLNPSPSSLPFGFATNVPAGLSLLGTYPSIPLPAFLSDQSSSRNFPWAGYDAASMRAPDTGATRLYNFTISRSVIAPDGINKSVILVNGQYPGPTIEANWGDTIQVQVYNQIGADSSSEEGGEGVSLHWHGLTQNKTPWMDGVPGVTQCPIPPGSAHTYTFQADQYGTSWYHSHYSAQYTDGLHGPMVIHGPPTVPYDIDLGPVLITEYLHESYYLEMKNIFKPAPPIFPNIDNNLINGKGQCDKSSDNCDPRASLAKFNFTSGKTHRLRLVNVGGAATQKFSVDNHDMMVIANDFIPVIPYQTDVVTLGPGQRADVLVQASSDASQVVWMRSDIDTMCLNSTSTIATALAAVYYERANTSSVPKTSGHSWYSNACRNDPLTQTVPLFPQSPTYPASTSRQVEINLYPNSTAQILFYLDNSSFVADYNTPTLLSEQQGQRTYARERNVYDFGSNSSVQLIFKSIFPTMHAMHLHGHYFWVLAEGYGDWDGKATRPNNPQRRDTHMMAPGTPERPYYTVIQWSQDNPGVWPLHCHMAAHVSAGLYLNVVERPDDIEKLRIPQSSNDLCRSWKAWTVSNAVDQIDSGV